MCFEVNVNWQRSQNAQCINFLFSIYRFGLLAKKIRSQGVAYKLSLMELKLNPNFSCYCSVK